MRPTMLVLVALAFTSFAQGAVGQFVSPGQVYTKSDLVFILVEAVLIFMWYRMDSDQRGYRRSVWLNVGVVGLALVALPYYFFRTRGARGGFVALGASLACTLMLGILTVVGEYATYYVLQS